MSIKTNRRIANFFLIPSHTKQRTLMVFRNRLVFGRKAITDALKNQVQAQAYGEVFQREQCRLFGRIGTRQCINFFHDRS